MSSELLLNWTLSTSAKASRNYNSKPLSLGKQNKLSKCRWWDLIRTNSQVKLVSKRTLHPRQHTSINDFYRVHCHQTKSQAMIVGLRWLNSQAGQRGSNPSRTAFFEVQALKANSPNSHLIAVWIYTQDYDRRVLQSKSRCNLRVFIQARIGMDNTIIKTMTESKSRWNSLKLHLKAKEGAPLQARDDFTTISSKAMIAGKEI